MSLFSSLTSAANTLSVFDNALSVVQNNVSNASTPGYADQTPTFEAQPFISGTGQIGGVASGPLQSSRDSYAETNVRNATSQLGYFQQQVQGLTALNSQFDISGNTGLPAALNQLFSAFSTWASTPSNSTARQGVINQADAVASAFQTTASNLAQRSQGVDSDTGSLVNQVNQLSSQLAAYNTQISSSGQLDPGTDAAVNSTLEKLSQIASVVTIAQPNGTFNVMLGGQTELVNGSTVNKLTASVYIPTRPLVTSGHAVTVPVNITAGRTDKLNLKVDGTTLPSITLSSADTTVAAVASDINTQLAAAGSTAKASVDSQGRLTIASGNKGANASVQILAGSANATLGLSAATPPNAQLLDSYGNDVTSQLTGGQLAATLQERNQALPGIQGDANQTGDLNRMAKAFADRVNQVVGVPLFTYDQNNAANVAASLQVNPAVTASQLPTAQVVSLTGSAAVTPFTITPGTNDKLNLNVDGTALPAITLNPLDTTLSQVVTDLNGQFGTLKIGATASLDPNTGALMLQTTNTTSSGSMQILSGTANATLGLGNPTPTYQGNNANNVVSLTGSVVANPVTIATGTNDTLNLNVNGVAAPPIALNPLDTTLSQVVTDLNSQFGTLKIGASASLDPNTGALMLQSTNKTGSGSIQILSGTANATLGLSNPTPGYQTNNNDVGMALASLANPGNSADELDGQSFTSFFGSIASKVGAQLANAKSGQTAQQSLVTQAQTLRQQVSGVDLNEEATRVLQLQMAYQAASKMISVIDTLTQSVLGIIPQASA